MSIGNVLVLTQATAFSLSFILSFFIVVPMTINQREFDGHCLLYANGHWFANGSMEAKLTDVSWGSRSACRFNIVIGILLMSISMFYAILESVHLAKSTNSSWLETFLTAIVTIIITLMLFATSLTGSLGFKEWCNFLTQPASGISSCHLAEYINFADDVGNINTSNFYSEMKIAQFGNWSCFVCWLFLIVISVIKILMFRQHEEFMISAHRERRRLLQHIEPVYDNTIT